MGQRWCLQELKTRHSLSWPLLRARLTMPLTSLNDVTFDLHNTQMNFGRFLIIAWIQFAVCAVVVAQSTTDLPKLRKHGEATQLIVSGKPFLVLGGELGNSSASDM